MRIFTMLVVLAFLFTTHADAQEIADHATLVGEFALWDPNVPLPAHEQLTYPESATDVVVQRADADWRFLHDNAIVWHDNILYAGWYNCPNGEIQGTSCIRSRHSADAGQTWSNVEVIAADDKGQGVFYVPVTFLSCDGQLYAFVSNMVGHDLVTRCEVFQLQAGGGWASRGFVAGPFLPNATPLLMADGNYIMAGRMATKAATTPEIPAVAISNGKRVTDPWQVVPMMKSIARPFTEFPESSVWVDGAEIIAVVRGGLVFTSSDYGRTWRGPFHHNVPTEDSKPFVIKLSTGQRCLLWNYPKSPNTSRHLLTIAVSRPNEQKLVAMWKLRDGASEVLQAAPEWSYPCAAERDGKLYVIYTSGKNTA